MLQEKIVSTIKLSFQVCDRVYKYVAGRQNTIAVDMKIMLRNYQHYIVLTFFSPTFPTNVSSFKVEKALKRRTFVRNESEMIALLASLLEYLKKLVKYQGNGSIPQFDLL